MKVSDVVVQSEVGLHARPAALFIKTAGVFSSRITIENLTRGMKPVNAKSILSVLSAGVRMNDRIRITTEGADEEAAIDALAGLVESNFGETK
jgi:phosphocarrier protein HPr